MVEKGRTSITVQWKKSVSLEQYHLSGFKIRYRKFGNKEYAYHKLSLWKFTAKISGLESNTLYEISVAGYSDDGTGQYAERIIERTERGQ